MLIGYFDYAIIGILIFLNIIFWKKNIKQSTGCILGGILFGIVLPIISMIIELEIVEATKGGWTDSLEVIYTYLKFPTYWFIGIIQIIITAIKISTRKNNGNE